MPIDYFIYNQPFIHFCLTENAK